MIVLPCQQGTAEWAQARLGIPTASAFHRIITPSTLKPSAQAEAYLCELLAERFIGEPLDDAASDLMWTARGSEMEQRALAWYEVTQDVEVQRVGFVALQVAELRAENAVHGDPPDLEARYGKHGAAPAVGCSPDGLIRREGGLEIKCPNAANHMRWLRASQAGGNAIDKKYMTQVQGSLWITGREYWDTLSFNPVMPPALVRVERDEDYIDKLSRAVLTFTEVLRQETERMEITWPALLERVGREVEASA